MLPSGDNLPVAPAHLAVAPVHDAQPVVDTPEVVEAKAAFFQAYNAAKSGISKRSAQVVSAGLPLTYAASPAINYANYAPALNYAHAPAITTNRCLLSEVLIFSIVMISDQDLVFPVHK